MIRQAERVVHGYIGTILYGRMPSRWSNTLHAALLFPDPHHISVRLSLNLTLHQTDNDRASLCDAEPSAAHYLRPALYKNYSHAEY